MPADPPSSLSSIKSLDVYLAKDHVGTLAQTPDGTLAFQYTRTWVENGFSLSPFSLPLTNEVFVARPQPLDGVFGVFDDSMPDGWGRLLVDRMLRERGIDPFTIGPLARLAIVGATGMGALEYRQAQELISAREARDLDALAEDCASLLETDASADLDTLFALAGSSGGARPKVLTTIDGEDWIVKFPASFDPIDIGAREFALARAAAECGIEMPEVRLLPSKRCAGYFAVKRFDRERTIDDAATDGVRKIHMASAGALLEASHRVPNLDYDLLFKLTMKLTGDASEVRRLFSLMVFNVLCGNRDDHAKNFSFLCSANGTWHLSPAYDLTENAGINGKRSTTVNGKGKSILSADIIEVASRIGIPRTRALAEIENVSAALEANGLSFLNQGRVTIERIRDRGRGCPQL